MEYKLVPPLAQARCVFAFLILPRLVAIYPNPKFPPRRDVCLSPPQKGTYLLCSLKHPGLSIVVIGHPNTTSLDNLQPGALEASSIEGRAQRWVPQPTEGGITENLRAFWMDF